MMGNTALLYLIIITTAYSQAVLPHHNCSNVQPTSSSDNNSSSDGMDDLVVVPLQYCIIDNSTIMRIDTGETLDIVYTTDSLIVVTPTDGHTSIVVPKNNATLACLTSDDHDGQITEIVICLIVSVLITLISGYIVVVFLMLKEIRNAFGKLIMFHSCALVLQCSNNFMLISVHFFIALHSQTACQIIMFIYMQGSVAHEAFATCILAFLAYIMYCSINLWEITKKMEKGLFKKYLSYVFGSVGLMNLLIVFYDFNTGNYKHLLLPDGHCAFNDVEIYNTLIIPYSFAVLNKIFQIIIFVVYLYYFYKFIVISANAVFTNINRQLKKKFTRIVFAFGTVIGLSQFTWILGNLTGHRSYGRLMGTFFFLLQQCAVLVILVCTKKVTRLCRKKFSSKILPSVTLYLYRV